MRVFLDNIIAEQQLMELEHIAALPMSSTESKTIKPAIEMMDSLLRDWISADKDVKGDSYALKKMMVIFPMRFFHFNVFIVIRLSHTKSFFRRKKMLNIVKLMLLFWFRTINSKH